MPKTGAKTLHFHRYEVSYLPSGSNARHILWLRHFLFDSSREHCFVSVSLPPLISWHPSTAQAEIKAQNTEITLYRFVYKNVSNLMWNKLIKALTLMYFGKHKEAFLAILYMLYVYVITIEYNPHKWMIFFILTERDQPLSFITQQVYRLSLSLVMACFQLHLKCSMYSTTASILIFEQIKWAPKLLTCS